jgi:hypothetical protein
MLMLSGPILVPSVIQAQPYLAMCRAGLGLVPGREKPDGKNQAMNFSFAILKCRLVFFFFFEHGAPQRG